MIALNVSIPPQDIAAMDAMFARYVQHFGGNVPKAVEQAAVKIVVALRARTRTSKKQRRIVTNPARYRGKNGMNAMGRAHAHIIAWYDAHGTGRRTGRVQHWLPKLRDLVDRKASAKFAVERFTQKGKRYTPVGGFDPLDKIKVSDAKAMAARSMPNVLNIVKRGTARASWAWMLKRLGKSQASEQPEVDGAVQVNKHALGKGDGLTYVDLINALGYIRKATTRGDVSAVISSATTMMRKQIERDLDKAKKAAGAGA